MMKMNKPKENVLSAFWKAFNAKEVAIELNLSEQHDFLSN